MGWCCQHEGRGCEYVTDIPDFTCRTTASLEEACREVALARGLKLGGSGHAFAGNFKTKGCYYYATGTYAGRAYFGRKQNGREPSGSQIKLGTFCDPRSKRTTPRGHFFTIA